MALALSGRHSLERIPATFTSAPCNRVFIPFQPKESIKAHAVRRCPCVNVLVSSSMPMPNTDSSQPLQPDHKRDQSPEVKKHKSRRAQTAEKLRVQRHESAVGCEWEFVHPRCARKRRDDMAEVEAMVEAGETDIARDELVWLLSECPDFLDAHVHLGLIALEDGDPKLARGHFGRAYELGLRALDAADNSHPLPYVRPSNRPFFEAAKGLVHCLIATGREAMTKDIQRRLAQLDPTDPLGIARMTGIQGT